MVSLEETNVFDSHYYKLNKTLMSLVGQFPNQTRQTKVFILLGIMIGIISLMIPQAIRLFQLSDDLDIVIECITPMITNLGCFVKLNNCIFNTEKLKILHEKIIKDWTLVKDESQMKIIKRYAESNRLLTKVYTIYVYLTLYLYCMIPILPVFMDTILPLNESRPLKPLYHVQYFVDHDKYFYPIWLHGFASSILTITILIAIDTMYVMYVEHACGIFAIVKYRLEQVAGTESIDSSIDLNSKNERNRTRNKDKEYNRVVECIVSHRNAIEHAIVLQSAYSVSFFLQLGMSMLLMSLTGVQTVIKMGEPEQMLRFGAFTLAQMFHLFFNSLPGQRLMDHSLGITESVKLSCWYNLSPKTRKLLIMILLRSKRSSNISAGKLYVMSMENFCTVMQTSMSYFTMLSSVR